MIKETGKIIFIEDGIAVVECISKSACSGCHNQSGCGVGTVAKTFSDKTHQVEVPYKEGMKVDEFVELQINNRDLVSGAIVAYLVPLIFFIGGALLAKQFYSLNEGSIIAIAISSGFIGFMVTRFTSNRLFPKNQLNSIIGTELKK